MDIITALQNKKDTEAYQLFLQLEKESAESQRLYAYFDDFIHLLGHKSSFVRVRGFRLACAQARWDKENKIERTIDLLLSMLDDEKPAAVRQCLAVLPQTLQEKPGLARNVEEKLKVMRLEKYQDSMASLLKKDIAKLQKAINHMADS